MIRALLACAALAAGTQAAALSCMVPDVTAAYRTAQAAAKRHLVVLGTLHFDQARLPRANGNESPPRTPIAARLTGQALTESGFDFAFDRPITLEVLCWGPWCGGAGSGTRYLAFLREGAEGHVLSADPCGTMLFQDPSGQALETVARCVREGRCPAQ